MHLYLCCQKQHFEQDSVANVSTDTNRASFAWRAIELGADHATSTPGCRLFRILMRTTIGRNKSKIPVYNWPKYVFQLILRVRSRSVQRS